MYAIHQLSNLNGAGQGLPQGAKHDSLETIFAARPVETVAAGHPAFWQGDATSDVFQVMEGCLRLFRVLPDGRRAIIGFAFAGRVLGLAARVRHANTGEAVTDVKLRRVPRRAFHAAVDARPELRPQLFALIFDEMAAVEEQAVMLSCKKAEERLASFLATIVCRTGADLRVPIEIELPMGRQDIADYIGLTIETVSRTFSKFKRDGLIALNGHRTVRVERMRKLVELAGDLDNLVEGREPYGNRDPTRH